MFQIKKKGFTIVELVIVIAVVAILAAVLIPTFASLIDQANVSNDMSVAKSINTALVAAEAEGKIDSVNKAVEALHKRGFSLGNLNPSAEGNYYVWDSKSNQILYVNKENLSKPLFYSKEGYGDVSTWWLPISSTEKMDDAFTNFLITEDEAISSSLEFNRPIGLSVLSGKKINMSNDAVISIKTQDSGVITLDGTFFGELTIDAPNCDLIQQGSLVNLNITQIASASAHIHGFIENLFYKAGHVVIEPKGYVSNWNDQSTEKSTDNSIEIKGVISNITSSGKAIYNLNGGTIISSSVETLPEGLTENDIGFDEDYSWDISDVSDLLRFRDAVNSGYTFYGITVKLVNDIDISHINWTTPIGSIVTYTEGSSLKVNVGTERPFYGTFDGTGHTINGLTIHDAPSGGYGGGFFGYVALATIKNVTFTDVDINSDVQASPIAALLYYYTTVENVKVYGTAKSPWTAGIANYAQYNVTINDCVIDMDFICEGYDTEKSESGNTLYPRLGGLIGQFNYYDLSISNIDLSGSTFTLVGGDAVNTAFVGGYVAQYSGGTLYVDYSETAITKTNGNGDCDPAVVGITMKDNAGNPANISPRDYNFKLQ